METITHLQEIIERGRQAAEERKRREGLDAIARQEKEAAQYRDRLHKSGLPEWMIEYLSVKLYDGDAWYTLALPGCAPVAFTVITYTDGTRCYDKISVRVAEEVCYDQDAELWRIRYSYDHLPRGADSLDEAIALAADYGESWHAMSAEAERRNAEGLRPTTPTPAEPTPQPKQEDGADVLDSARTILRNYINGETIADLEFQDDRQSTVVIASMLAAIAVEVRRLTNTIGDLTDGQQLADAVKIWGGE